MGVNASSALLLRQAQGNDEENRAEHPPANRRGKRTDCTLALVDVHYLLPPPSLRRLPLPPCTAQHFNPANSSSAKATNPAKLIGSFPARSRSPSPLPRAAMYSPSSR